MSTLFSKELTKGSPQLTCENFLEFLVKMNKMTLKIKVNDVHLQYQLQVSYEDGWCNFFLIPAQICEELACGQGKV